MESENMEFVSRDERSVGIPKLSFPIERRYNWILASCCGLLCILVSDGTDFNLYVGNPVLNDWRLIPNPPHPVRLRSGDYGLAVDLRNSSGCYKFIGLRKPEVLYHDIDGSREYSFEVFSSETGTWKLSKTKITVLRATELDSRAVYLRGTLYWKYGFLLLWFDPSDDRGGLQPLPFKRVNIAGGEIGEWYATRGEIGEWNNVLTYTRVTDMEIQVWSMDQSHWSKSYSIELENIIERNLELFSPLCHRMCLRNRKPSDTIKRHYKVMPMPFNGDVLFFLIQNIMFWYDMETGAAGKQELGDDYTYGQIWFPDKNCLVSSPSFPSASM